jgi:hypothetical protein
MTVRLAPPHAPAHRCPMRNRIVLSCLLTLLFACGGPSDADDVADGIGTSPSLQPDAGLASFGIGTSPSTNVSAGGLVCYPVQPCGVWVRHSDEFDVELASRTRDADVVVFSLPGGLSCADAIAVSEVVFPGEAFVRYVDPRLSFRAKGF